MTRRSLWVQVVILIWLAAPAFAQQHWSQWRGPWGQGVADGSWNVPLNWKVSPEGNENVAWKLKLPGPGNSTPVVWQDRVFVTCANAAGTQRSLICIDRGTGQQVWQRDVKFTKKEQSHRTNPQCSASPVTDGKIVVAWFGSAGVHAFDLEGQPLWQRDVGTFEHFWGTAASPVIYKDLVLLNLGPGLRAFAMALSLKSGDEVWRYEVPEMVSEKIDQFRGSWSTPVLDTRQTPHTLFLSLPRRLHALDPATGKVRWTCEGLGELVYTSPLVHSQYVVAMSGYHGPAMAVKRGGEGELSEAYRVWHHVDKPDLPQRVGSGIVVGDHIYILNEPGIASCIEVATGKRLWNKRMSRAKSWSSMAYLDGKLFITNMDGTTFVIRPDPEKLHVIAENPIPELTRASLAFAKGQVFIRTYEHLYCVGK